MGATSQPSRQPVIRKLFEKLCADDQPVPGLGDVQEAGGRKATGFAKTGRPPPRSPWPPPNQMRS